MTFPAVSFGSPCHRELGWPLVRHQLPAARSATASSAVPPLPVVLQELVSLNHFRETTGRLPFEGPAWRDFRSLSADLKNSAARAGSRLRRTAFQQSNAVPEPEAGGQRGGGPAWTALLQRGQEAGARIGRPEALVMAFDDAMDAALADPAVAFSEIGDRLDTLRSLVEYHGRDWKDVADAITDALTIRSYDDAGRPMGGRFDRGVDPDKILDAIRDDLRREPVERVWAVWIATLAGPAPARLGEATRGAAITVSSFACDGDVSSWLRAVRDELTAAFVEDGLEVPADIQRLGEPMLMGDYVVLSAEDLWSDLAQPPSFVTRVAVRATRAEDAIARAHRALRAVFSQGDRAVASDIRPDSRVWSEQGGWHIPSVTASGRSRGETDAARTAARTVSRWSRELGDALDADSIERLETRALVRDPTAPLALRLLRAFISLEALPRGPASIEVAAQHLWLFSAWEHYKQVLANVLYDVALQPLAIGPTRAGASPDASRDRIAALRRRLARESLRWSMCLFDVVDGVMLDVHPHAMSRGFVAACRAKLNDPQGLQTAENAHRDAWARARRHRNLVAHGWPMGDLVLAPTAAFLADQLEVAIVADNETRMFAWLGSLRTEPAETWADRTPAALVDAVAATSPD